MKGGRSYQTVRRKTAWLRTSGSRNENIFTRAVTSVSYSMIQGKVTRVRGVHLPGSIIMFMPIGLLDILCVKMIFWPVGGAKGRIKLQLKPLRSYLLGMMSVRVRCCDIQAHRRWNVSLWVSGCHLKTQSKQDHHRSHDQVLQTIQSFALRPKKLQMSKYVLYRWETSASFH